LEERECVQADLYHYDDLISHGPRFFAGASTNEINNALGRRVHEAQWGRNTPTKRKGSENMNNKNGSEKMNKETEPKVLVELANENGHDAMMMTKPEALKLVKQNSEHWIFMSGRLVDAADITGANWPEMAENNTKVQLTPGLIGGWL
jgi:hypothetical protein